MVLPLCMLHNLQMPLRHKVGLAALFLIGTIDMAADIARTIDTVGGSSLKPNTLWDILEVNLAVIVSALVVYKSLLRRHKQREVALHAG